MSALVAGQLTLTPVVFRQIVFVPNIADEQDQFSDIELWAKPNKLLRKKKVMIFFDSVCEVSEFG